jgi:uncharacterized protein (TIGR00369 family)
MADPRTRTTTWTEPAPALTLGRSMSGLEFLLATQRGEIPPPPSHLLLGIKPTSVERGRVVMGLTPDEHHYNPVGVVQGGLVATLLDAAMGCAVASTLEAGSGYTTLELKVNFLRALTAETGPVEAEGRIIHEGGRVALAQGQVTDRDGNLYAHGTTTCLLNRK